MPEGMGGLNDKMGVELVEVCAGAGRGHDAGRGQHPALRPAARRRLGGARRDPRLDRVGAPRVAGQGRGRRRHQRHPPPLGDAAGPSPAWRTAIHRGRSMRDLRGRHHRRARHARVHLADHLHAGRGGTWRLSRRGPGRCASQAWPGRSLLSPSTPARRRGAAASGGRRAPGRWRARGPGRGGARRGGLAPWRSCRPGAPPAAPAPSRARKRLASRETLSGPGADVADAVLLGEGHAGLHQRAADAAATVGRQHVRRHRLHERLEVERGHGGGLEHDGAGDAGRRTRRPRAAPAPGPAARSRGAGRPPAPRGRPGAARPPRARPAPARRPAWRHAAPRGTCSQCTFAHPRDRVAAAL